MVLAELRGKRKGDVSRKSLATIATVLIVTGPSHFNQICKVAGTMFGVKNRTTVSRCLKALVERQLARKKLERTKKIYSPVLPNIVDLLVAWRREQEAAIRRVPRIPGLRTKHETQVQPLAWYDLLWRLPEVRNPPDQPDQYDSLGMLRKLPNATRSAASNLLLDHLVRLKDPAKYRFLKRHWHPPSTQLARLTGTPPCSHCGVDWNQACLQSCSCVPCLANRQSVASQQTSTS